jgi:hypothetical protein
MRGTVIAALLLASPVAAQDRMTPEDCVASWNAGQDLVPFPVTADSIVADSDGWCDAAGVVFEVDDVVSGYVSQMRWRGSDITRFTENGLPPRALEIEFEGIASLPQINDPVFDYIYGIQAKASDMRAGLSVRWDSLQSALIVDDAFFAFGDVDAIRLSARISGVDLTDVTTMQTSIGSAGLRDLSASMTFDGWFEAFALKIIGPTILDGESNVPMEEQAEQTIAVATGFIEGLSDDILVPSSKDALNGFIETMPSPRGVLRLQFSADPPLGMARFIQLGTLAPDTAPQDLVARLFEGTTQLVTWSPAGGAQ